MNTVKKKKKNKLRVSRNFLCAKTGNRETCESDQGMKYLADYGKGNSCSRSSRWKILTQDFLEWSRWFRREKLIYLMRCRAKCWGRDQPGISSHALTKFEIKTEISAVNNKNSPSVSWFSDFSHYPEEGGGRSKRGGRWRKKRDDRYGDRERGRREVVFYHKEGETRIQKPSPESGAASLSSFRVHSPWVFTRFI